MEAAVNSLIVSEIDFVLPSVFVLIGKNSRKIILLPQRNFDFNWMFDLLLWMSVNIGAKLKKRYSFVTGKYFFLNFNN